MPVVLIFAKPPVEGKVKTRLIPDLGKTKATEVYRYCLNYTLKLLRNSSLDYQIYISEAGNDALFANETCRLQQGKDLGERMYQALQQSLQQHPDDCVLLIGSDCLDLKEPHLTQAINALTNHDLVLIPSLDGGFALIGCREINSALFAGVEWSSERVLRQTLANAEQLNYRVHLLESLRDIDTLADLNHYPALHQLIAKD